MTGIFVFESRHGQIAVEVDDSVARAAGGTAVANDLVTKGSRPVGGEVLAKAPKSFEDAMASLNSVLTKSA